jgi:hypothetical protein
MHELHLSTTLVARGRGGNPDSGNDTAEGSEGDTTDGGTGMMHVDMLVAAGLTPVWEWLESTSVADLVGNSVLLTGLLSGLHVVGMTLIAGAVVVSGIQLLAGVLTTTPVQRPLHAPIAGITWGLALSVTTGVLLFAPRATEAVHSPYFRWKMAALAAAVLFHFGLYRRIPRRVRATGARGLATLAIALWFTVVGLGCAYILLE